MPAFNHSRWATPGGCIGWLCLWAWILFAPGSVVKAAPTEEAPEKKHVVALTHGPLLDGSGWSDAAFVSNLRVHLAELDLTLGAQELPLSADLAVAVSVAKKQTEVAKAFLVVWTVRENEGRVVYLYDPVGPHLHARSLTVKESSAAASEEVALILRSEIQARMQGSELPMPEVALPKPTQVAPKAPKGVPAVTVPSPGSQRDPRLGLGPGFIFTHPLRDQHGQPGLGLRAWGRGHRFRGGLAYVFVPQFSVSSDQARITINRHPMEAYGGYEVWKARLPTLVAELGCQADAIRRRTDMAEAPLSSQPPSWHWSAALVGRLRGEVRLLANLAVNLGLGMEILLNPYDFEVAVATERRAIARLAPVRLTLEMGLTLLAW